MATVYSTEDISRIMQSGQAKTVTEAKRILASEGAQPVYTSVPSPAPTVTTPTPTPISPAPITSVVTSTPYEAVAIQKGLVQITPYEAVSIQKGITPIITTEPILPPTTHDIFVAKEYLESGGQLVPSPFGGTLVFEKTLGQRQQEAREELIKQVAQTPQAIIGAAITKAPSYVATGLGGLLTGKFLTEVGREEIATELRGITEEWTRTATQQEPIYAARTAMFETAGWEIPFAVLPTIGKLPTGLKTVIGAGLGVYQTYLTAEAVKEPTIGKIGAAAFMPVLAAITLLPKIPKIELEFQIEKPSILTSILPREEVWQIGQFKTEKFTSPMKVISEGDTIRAFREQWQRTEYPEIISKQYGWFGIKETTKILQEPSIRQFAIKGLTEMFPKGGIAEIYGAKLEAIKVRKEPLVWFEKYRDTLRFEKPISDQFPSLPKVFTAKDIFKESPLPKDMDVVTTKGGQLLLRPKVELKMKLEEPKLEMKTLTKTQAFTIGIPQQIYKTKVKQKEKLQVLFPTFKYPQAQILPSKGKEREVFLEAVKFEQLQQFKQPQLQLQPSLQIITPITPSIFPQAQIQVPKQIIPSRTKQLLDLREPSLIPPPLAFGISLGAEPKRKRGRPLFARRYKYTPTVFGMMSGLKIRKAPKDVGIQSVGIRFPVGEIRKHGLMHGLGKMFGPGPKVNKRAKKRYHRNFFGSLGI